MEIQLPQCPDPSVTRLACLGTLSLGAQTRQCHHAQVLVANAVSEESSTRKGALSCVFQKSADTQFAHRVTGLPVGIEHQDCVGPLSKW